MIYAVIMDEAQDRASLYTFETFEAYHRETFSPDRRTVAAWTDEKTTLKKENARMELLNLASAAAAPGLSYRELSIIAERAQTVARNARLIREARENGIC